MRSLESTQNQPRSDPESAIISTESTQIPPRTSGEPPGYYQDSPPRISRYQGILLALTGCQTVWFTFFRGFRRCRRPLTRRSPWTKDDTLEYRQHLRASENLHPDRGTESLMVEMVGGGGRMRGRSFGGISWGLSGSSSPLPRRPSPPSYQQGISSPLF
jgi:hypothetical protein